MAYEEGYGQALEQAETGEYIGALERVAALAHDRVGGDEELAEALRELDAVTPE